MTPEGLNYLKSELELVVVPLSVGAEFEVLVERDLLNYDLNLRSKLVFDKNKDYAISFHISEEAINTLRPKEINSFLILSAPDSASRAVCYGEVKNARGEIFIPSGLYNFSQIKRINIVDFYQPSLVYGRDVEVNSSASSAFSIKLINFSLNAIEGKYVKIIDSSGRFFAVVGHEVLEKRIYSNVEFKSIVEYSITL